MKEYMKVYNLVPVILNTPIIPWSSCFHIIIIIIIIIIFLTLLTKNHISQNKNQILPKYTSENA